MTDTTDTRPIDPNTVHYSYEAFQPDVHLRCGRWTTPAWSPRAGLPDLVYQCDEGDLYTFERMDLVNCEECKALQADRDAIERGDDV